VPVGRADHEGARARTSGESRGFGIEMQEVFATRSGEPREGEIEFWRCVRPSVSLFEITQARRDFLARDIAGDAAWWEAWLTQALAHACHATKGGEVDGRRFLWEPIYRRFLRSEASPFRR